MILILRNLFCAFDKKCVFNTKPIFDKKTDFLIQSKYIERPLKIKDKYFILAHNGKVFENS